MRPIDKSRSHFKSDDADPGRSPRGANSPFGSRPHHSSSRQPCGRSLLRSPPGPDKENPGKMIQFAIRNSLFCSTLQVSPLAFSTSVIHRRKRHHHAFTASQYLKSQCHDITNQALTRRHGDWSLQTDGGNHHPHLKPPLRKVGSDSPEPPPFKHANTVPPQLHPNYRGSAVDSDSTTLLCRRLYRPPIR